MTLTLCQGRRSDQGPVRLRRIDRATSWIADNSTWKSGLTRIYPARQFKRDVAHSSWLQSEDIAFIYRAYAAYDNPLAITSPGLWPQELADSECHRRADQFAATNLIPGYHVFSVLGTDDAGMVRTSNPVMVVVRSSRT